LPDTAGATSSDVEVVRGLYAGGPVDLAAIFANESATLKDAGVA
jgi:hypothetical protein